MIQDIIDGIIEKIKSEYVGYDVYTESVEQGLNEPCFSILCLTILSDRKLGSRQERNYKFMIRYFPSTQEPRSECLTVCDKLNELLTSINTNNGVIHGNDFEGNVVDNVLQYEVTYSLFVQEQYEQESMEEIELSQGVIN